MRRRSTSTGRRVVTSASVSPVAVSSPRRSVASYALRASMRKRENLVASPNTSGRSPVANGSSVPVWPPFSEASARLARARARVEVRPAGLSRRRTPSGPALRARTLAARAPRGLGWRCDGLVDQLRKAHAALDGLVELEMQLRHLARGEA